MAPRKAVRNTPQPITPEVRPGFVREPDHIQRADAAMAARAMPREVQPPRGRAVAIGRDGKPIWRHSTQQDHDPYAFAKDLAPSGWFYEWKAIKVVNQEQTSYMAKLYRDGWTPVPAERHPGVFFHGDKTGSIEINGLLLMERPIALHEEAMREAKYAADERVHRAKSERGLPSVSPGIDTNTPDARRVTFVKEERMLDSVTADELAAVKPKYDYSTNTID